MCACVQRFIGLQAPNLVLNKSSQVTPTGGAQPFYTNVFKVLMQGFAGMQVSVFLSAVDMRLYAVAFARACVQPMWLHQLLLLSHVLGS